MKETFSDFRPALGFIGTAPGDVSPGMIVYDVMAKRCGKILGREGKPRIESDFVIVWYDIVEKNLSTFMTERRSFWDNWRVCDMQRAYRVR